MPSRNGKISNLPNDIREQLNLRLLEGDPGKELAAWLNALPVVQSVLDSQFNGTPISEVNLTHWRQGGYLQWLTERHCFDSAQALAEGGCRLAETGLSAERLLNVLTLRYGEILMRWDFSPDGNEATIFSEMARKVRILQGICRSVLAIHRIQSQQVREQPDLAKPPVNSPIPSKIGGQPSPATLGCLTEVLNKASKSGQPFGEGAVSTRRFDRLKAQSLPTGSKPRACRGGEPIRDSKSTTRNILSGPIAPSSIPTDLSHTPFKADLDLSEALSAV